MMNDIKFKLPVKLYDLAVNANLPQVIVELKATAPFFPETSPTRKIKIIEMNVGKRCSLGGSFDGGAIAFARDYANVRKTRNFAHPIPADTRLGALTGLASVRRKQHARTRRAIVDCIAHDLAEVRR